MTHEKTRFFAYICPHCRQTVIAEKPVFALAAAPAGIKCPCGRSELKIEVLPQRVHLSVPCVACGREHLVTCPTHSFLRERALAFSCASSGLDCCYVGEEGPVYAAAARLERAVDKLEASDRSSGEPDQAEKPFLDPLIMEEVLAEIRDIAARGGVSCTCGSKRWTFQVNYSSVDLQCRDCGAQMRIPAATADDLDDVCCKTRLLIRGKESK